MQGQAACNNKGCDPRQGLNSSCTLTDDRLQFSLERRWADYLPMRDVGYVTFDKWDAP
jgi:hypothetical protein